MNHSRRRTARERALRGEVEAPLIAARREQIREAIEVGGVLPLTSELLSRIAAAPRVDVDVRWNADGAVVTFDDRAA